MGRSWTVLFVTLRKYLLQIRSDEDGGVSVDDHTPLSYCRHVASGMAYLSSKAFVHRDLGVLVSDDDICKVNTSWLCLTIPIIVQSRLLILALSHDLMDGSYYISHGGKIPVK